MHLQIKLQLKVHMISNSAYSSTCFTIQFWVHNDKLRSQFADATTLENWHQTSQVFQIEGITGASCFWVLLWTFHSAVQAFIPSCWIAHKVSDVIRIRDWWLVRWKRLCIKFNAYISIHPKLHLFLLYLDSWNEGSGNVGTEEWRHVQFSYISLLFKSTGNALLTQKLQAGHTVLHTNYVQGWSTGQKQTRVPVTPANSGDGPLN